MYPIALPVGNNVRLFMFGVNGNPGTFVIEVNPYGSLVCGIAQSGHNYFASSSGVLPINTWTDVEISVFNGNLFCLINGALDSTKPGLDMPTGGAANRILIGSDDAGLTASDGRYQGYLSEVQICANAGRHAGPFTPNSAPFAESLDLHAIKSNALLPLLRRTPPAWRAFRKAAPTVGVDTEHGGRGRVIGTTRNTGIPDYPVSRRVRLARKRDGVLARETWSDAAGNYLFEHVRHDIEYVVTAHDHTGLYNAVIADSVTPELMP